MEINPFSYQEKYHIYSPKREREIKFIGLFGYRGHCGPYSPYKPCNHIFTKEIQIKPHGLFCISLVYMCDIIGWQVILFCFHGISDTIMDANAWLCQGWQCSPLWPHSVQDDNAICQEAMVLLNTMNSNKKNKVKIHNNLAWFSLFDYIMIVNHYVIK